MVVTVQAATCAGFNAYKLLKGYKFKKFYRETCSNRTFEPSKFANNSSNLDTGTELRKTANHMAATDDDIKYATSVKVWLPVHVK
jgi:hypothetical protein